MIINPLEQFQFIISFIDTLFILDPSFIYLTTPISTVAAKQLLKVIAPIIGTGVAAVGTYQAGRLQNNNQLKIVEEQTKLEYAKLEHQEKMVRLQHDHELSLKRMEPLKDNESNINDAFEPELIISWFNDLSYENMLGYSIFLSSFIIFCCISSLFINGWFQQYNIKIEERLKGLPLKLFRFYKTVSNGTGYLYILLIYVNIGILFACSFNLLNL